MIKKVLNQFGSDVFCWNSLEIYLILMAFSCDDCTSAVSVLIAN